MNNIHPLMQKYFSRINAEVKQAYEIATIARQKGFDPSKKPEVQIAKNMAERVVGLVSVMAPQIIDSPIVQRIQELEEQYNVLDWRVAFIIAHEVATQQHCTFSSDREAIEIGIRIGFAYVTNGVVSSPLEGFVNLEIKERMDKKGKYFCINFSGPIRNAGGTAAAVSVLIADYVRKKLGYAEYDATNDEVNRCYSEIGYYHERVANLQYYPSEEEIIFLVKNIPIEISGDPSEKFDVPNYKNLPRVPTNKLRSGYCLLYSGCIPLKAPKLWKQLAKWGSEMDMGQWNFLEEFISIQKKAKAKSTDGASSEKKEKIAPIYTYIKDLVAGRPVFSHPMRAGGFRLRYGRSRLSGLSGQSLHPATMIIANRFIATGSQLKVERPGKAAAYTVCDELEGPIVRLNSGEVVQVTSEEQAIKIYSEVEKILFLGDVLINYGDFLDRAHPLIPPGYCPEWWVQEAKVVSVPLREDWIKHPTKALPSFVDAVRLSQEYNIPLHPQYSFFYYLLSLEEIVLLQQKILSSQKEDKIIFSYSQDIKTILEKAGIPHTVSQHEFIICNKEVSQILLFTFAKKVEQVIDIGSFLKESSGVCIRDKAGIFIGGRLGRPEKAKMRKLTGSPHVLFPVGEEGGRLRSFNEAFEKGKITALFENRSCMSCNTSCVLARCPKCGSETRKEFFCKECGRTHHADCPRKGIHSRASKQTISTKQYVDDCMNILDWTVYPDLIKGVRGVMGDEKVSEHLVKGFLRAHHDICVNKDGTVRYDASEVPVTHFRPRELGLSVEKTLWLGYETDIHSNPITSVDQVIELFAQDVILPACPEAVEERADTVLLRTAQFVDDLLVKLYGLEPFYNATSAEDLIGHYVIALAPHTSAGTIGRIIGFSQTQGLFYHPYLHCATRRDCFTQETVIPLKKEGVWSLRPLGEVVESLQPTTIVDSHGTRESSGKGYTTLGMVNGAVTEVPVNTFTKHTEMPIIRLQTSFGREVRSTENHKHIIIRDGKEQVLPAHKLRVGDVVKIPYSVCIQEENIDTINLIDELSQEDWVVVQGLKAKVTSLRKELILLGVSKKQADNYSFRDSVPILFARKIIQKYSLSKNSLFVSAKRDSVRIPAIIPLSDDFLSCLGLYVAKGYARQPQSGKAPYQICIATSKQEIRDFVKKTFSCIGLKPSEHKTDRVIFSSRILYYVCTKILSMGSSAYEKRLPHRLLSLPKNRLGKILGGYLEGDGSVSCSDLRITFDAVSTGLQQDLIFALSRYGIFVKFSTSTRKPGTSLQEFCMRKGREVPSFTCTKGVIQSKFFHLLSEDVEFISEDKRETQIFLLKNRSHKYVRASFDEQFFFDEIISLEHQEPEISYCLNVPGNVVVANGLLSRQCDGDEGCVFLAMDAFLNFSQKYLPSSRGGTMDAPLVLTTTIVPAEVDDMVFQMDIVWEYPLEFYEAACAYKMPWEVSLRTVNSVLNSPDEFIGLGFTHDTADINAGNHVSAYKILPTMQDKLLSQMDLAEKVIAVDERDVAKLVINKHFIRDLKGNLRKFSQQEFRCVKCNEKYRRTPIKGSCTVQGCSGKILFTISEGSVIKYLEPAESLVKKYDLDLYLKQSIDLTRRRIEEVFGKDPEKQLGLGEWF